MPTYAIISLGGKQHRVREGERLLVDRLPYGEGKTFHPDILFLGGDGEAELAPKGVQVTAKVVGHVLGEKIRIGKYKRRTGYKRHNGYRSRLSQVEIQTIKASRPAQPKEAAAKRADTKPKAETKKPATPTKSATRKAGAEEET